MGRRKTTLRKFFEIHLGYFLLRLWAAWVKRLSITSLVSYGQKMGILALYLLRKRKKIALNNLNLALGREKSQKEIEQICHGSFRNIGMDMMEISRCLDFEYGYIKEMVTFEGRQHLDHALRGGKGVIALTAHLGNFPLLSFGLVYEGYPLSLVARDPENPKVAKKITSFRNEIGIESIPDKPRRACVSKCLEALKRNRILYLQIDQNAPVTECWVDFFGYLVPTFKGPVIFSLRRGAPILPMFIIRNSDNHHQIIIHPAFELTMTGMTQDDITLNIARLTKIVEAVIREHPDQWWWIHQRFKRARDIRTGESLFPKHS
jgi:KDO2-lipid IV(A) lauroyltransferase